ncbi:aminodeoxychorismate lyase [Chimaeribacter californicus]|uniref:Aminodeoxychorismate lyase n=1 Tax=Chimaeribacter californicus TaxID=2060067 RepID=A0A2N5EFW5_9GAMM|nr:aminodeoxychorismate lyase [Chimaeribacter californicus]PLR41443.1 aminodeoxychorismate lyase [Chimaeribacter californicus]
MYWLNGCPSTDISLSDRAVQFGDGCFTTARVLGGSMQWLPAHLARLQRGAAALMIQGVDWQALEQEMVHAAAEQGQGVLKVIVTRGSGGRGYSPAGCLQPTRIVTTSSYPAHYSDWRERGVTLALSPVALAQSPLLAGIKHLNRLEQVMIRLHLEQTTADEALVLDTSGMLVECCAANLFWRTGQRVMTPDVTLSGVDGIMRQHILALLADHPDYQAEIVRAPMAVLAGADEVFICNALMPLLPVTAIGEWRYPSRTLFHTLIPYC